MHAHKQLILYHINCAIMHDYFRQPEVLVIYCSFFYLSTFVMTWFLDISINYIRQVNGVNWRDIM